MSDDSNHLGNASLKTQIFSAGQVSKRLPMIKCIESTAEALKALSNGKGVMPLRSVMTLPLENQTAFLGMMPSFMPGYIACKVISIYPGNRDPISSHQGVVLLFESGSGQLVSVTDAHEITGLRTAAASAVATKALVEPKKEVYDDMTGLTLAIMGTGTQAEYHLRSMFALEECSNIRFKKVLLFGRNTDKVQKLADFVKESIRPSVEVAQFEMDSEEIGQADVICTCTSSRTPILRGKLLKRGAHINAVGGCAPQFVELDLDCVKRCKLYCDSKTSCLKEPGEIVVPLETAQIDPDHFHQNIFVGEIGAVLEGAIDPAEHRSEADITVFESLGVALEDLTAAKAVLEA